MWLILEENSFNFNEKHFVQTYGIAIKGVARGVLGCPWPHLLQAFFNQTTYNRWRKCHDDTLAMVTIWWIPSLWQSVTPPLWKILATPLIAMGTKMAVAFSVFFYGGPWKTTAILGFQPTETLCLEEVYRWHIFFVEHYNGVSFHIC